MIVPLSQQRLSTAADYCVNASIWGTVMHSCRLHIPVEVQQKHFTLLSHYLYLRNGYPQLQTAYTGGSSTETLYSTKSLPLSQERLSTAADCIYRWKVNRNTFTLLCQYLNLRNAYQLLQTAYTKGKLTETASLYCVSTSILATLIHSCRLHVLVESQRK